MGSHIDTVPDAGAYDGILGVALPLVLLRTLEGRRLPYAVEVIAFSEEEGVRFNMPFLGSRALTGTLDGVALAKTDSQGKTLAQAIADYGLDSRGLADALLTPGTFAFVEVHIEQGPVLESLGLALGVVTGIVGLSRWELTFHGQANHAGTTPMHLRRDALGAAAAWIPMVESYARAEEIVATVGMIQAYPGAANVVPGKVVLSLDVRALSDRVRDRAVHDLMQLAESVATARGTTVTAGKMLEQKAVHLDAELIGSLHRAVNATTDTPHEMASGAGHDAMILADRVPAAMLFLRSPGGVSHHPSEAVLAEDIDAALRTCTYLLEHLDPFSKTVAHE
jgi:allantoate deiminase